MRGSAVSTCWRRVEVGGAGGGMEDDERAFDRRGKLIGTDNDMRTIVRVLVHDAAGEGAA